MKQIRISASVLNRYQYFLDVANGLHDKNGKERLYTFEQLLDDIAGVNPVGERANYGTALHKIMENPAEHYVELQLDKRTIDAYQCEVGEFTWTVYGGVVNEYIKQIRNPDALREYEFTDTRQINGVEVLTHGFVDFVNGLVAGDIKTSTKSVGEANHAASYQWKIYCKHLEITEFHYDHFQISWAKLPREFPLSTSPNVLSFSKQILHWEPAHEQQVREAMAEMIDEFSRRGNLDVLTYAGREEWRQKRTARQ